MTNKEKIRVLVKSREDIQKLRIRSSNRLKKDKDFKPQDTSKQNLTIATDDLLMSEVDLCLDFTQNEKKIDKLLKGYVEDEPIYQQFLKGVKGCGIQMSAVLISEIDIHIATTVSKIWQYAGLNPGMVFGKKIVGDKIVVSDTKIRGDKLTKGYKCPYNQFLKSKLLGVLADCMIKSNSPYREFYDNYKVRLSNESKWNEESKLHISNAAKRYMIKMFLIDLYVAWRTIEELPVRPSYQEEYLNHKHGEVRDN